MTEPIERVVDTSVIPDYHMVHLNGTGSQYETEEFADFDMLSVPVPGIDEVSFGPFFALVFTSAFQPAVTMEWWASAPPAINGGVVRGEGTMVVPDHEVTLTNTTGGMLGQVPLPVPSDRAHVRVTALDSGDDEVFVIQLWPAD